MFLDLDVVDFTDSDAPFISILLNGSLVRQVQPIDKGIQERYVESRNDAIEKQEDDPNVLVSDVEELPGQGAAIFMIAPQLGVYYTVTPYAQVKEQFMELARRKKDKAE